MRLSRCYIIYFELLPIGQTIDSKKYCQQLIKLDVAMKEKRSRVVNHRSVNFHHDNARPHTSKMTLTNWNSWNEKSYRIHYILQTLHPSMICFGHYKTIWNSKIFDSIKTIKNHITTFFDAMTKNHAIFSNVVSINWLNIGKWLVNMSLINKDGFFTITTARLFTNRARTFALIQ